MTNNDHDHLGRGKIESFGCSVQVAMVKVLSFADVSRSSEKVRVAASQVVSLRPRRYRYVFFKPVGMESTDEVLLQV
jgi:hypothetical protein